MVSPTESDRNRGVEKTRQERTGRKGRGGQRKRGEKRRGKEMGRRVVWGGHGQAL